MKYVKKEPKITAKIIDADTEKTILELNNRNLMNVGELFSEGILSTIISNELKNSKYVPQNIMVLVHAEYKVVK
jgi:hypothetical protein